MTLGGKCCAAGKAHWPPYERRRPTGFVACPARDLTVVEASRAGMIRRDDRSLN